MNLALSAVEVGTHVSRKVRWLQEAYLRNEASAGSALARLRHGVTSAAGSDLELIEFTTAGLYPDDVRMADAPTAAEHAAYTAITLYAVHQQSKRLKGMHIVDPEHPFTIGRAARQLVASTGAEEAVRRRFVALGTASSWDEVVHHSRGLIQQLRANDIPLDYGRFARDLLRLRSGRYANDVRNAWGRDFFRASTAGPSGEGAPPIDSDQRRSTATFEE